MKVIIYLVALVMLVCSGFGVNLNPIWPIALLVALQLFISIRDFVDPDEKYFNGERAGGDEDDR